jgi:hypothetical protein
MSTKNDRPHRGVYAVILPPDIARKVKVQAAAEDCSAKALIIRIAKAYVESTQAKALRAED